MPDRQGKAKLIKRESAEDSSQAALALRLSRPIISSANKRKRTFNQFELLECLEGASGNLRWVTGAYFENAKGVASIALVATRMLREMLYSRDQMTERDIQEMEHFLTYVGDESDIREYTEGLGLIGQNNGSASDMRFRDIFKKDHAFTF
ncbi:hypothetical protein ACQKWADRAFT_287627 [Trichoderma austrokoningii]